MNLDSTIKELREAAEEDAKMANKNGVSLNPFSTQGGRFLWQKGWNDERPANLTDGSIDWRFWERGRQARSLAQQSEAADAPSDAPNENF